MMSNYEINGVRLKRFKDEGFSDRISKTEEKSKKTIGSGLRSCDKLESTETLGGGTNKLTNSSGIKIKIIKIKIGNDGCDF